jgi:hypothetical protein
MENGVIVNENCKNGKSKNCRMIMQCGCNYAILIPRAIFVSALFQG